MSPPADRRRYGAVEMAQGLQHRKAEAAMPIDSITPCRSLISDRFPVASFAISLPQRRWFEVACATDPALFHTDCRKRRAPSNFYSSRRTGLLHAPKGEATFLIPSDQLRRFAGARRLYFALASYGDPRGRDPSFSIAPNVLDRTPFIDLAPDFTGRSLDRTRLRGESAPSENYGTPMGPLTWGGDAVLEETRRSETASETGDEPPYDDGYDGQLWSVASTAPEPPTGDKPVSEGDPSGYPSQDDVNAPGALDPEPCDGLEDGAQVRAGATALQEIPPDAPEPSPADDVTTGYEDGADLVAGAAEAEHPPSSDPSDPAPEPADEEVVDRESTAAAFESDPTSSSDAQPGGEGEEEIGEGYEDAESLYGAVGSDATTEAPEEGPITGSLRDADYAEEVEEEILPRGKAAQALGAAVLDIPEKVRLLRLVAQAESGAAGYSATNPDREYETPGHPAYHLTHIGLSWGFIQFTQRSGNLGLVLRAARDRSDALRAQGRLRAGQSFEELFGPAWQELLNVTSAATADERVAPVAGKELWDEAWVRRFQQAGQVDYVQNAQNEIAVRSFVDPNVAVARWLGLDSPRAFALLLDRVIHMGNGGGLAFVMRAVGPVQSEADRARALSALGAGDLRQFQQRFAPDLAVDGLWGSRTHAAMTSALRALGSRSPLPVPSREVMVERLVAASRGRSFEARMAALAAERPELDDSMSYALAVA
jgi:hypothetical protein